MNPLKEVSLIHDLSYSIMQSKFFVANISTHKVLLDLITGEIDNDVTLSNLDNFIFNQEKQISVNNYDVLIKYKDHHKRLQIQKKISGSTCNQSLTKLLLLVNGSKVMIWDTDTLKMEDVFEGDHGPYTHISFDENREQVFLCNYPRLTIMDLKRRTLIQKQLYEGIFEGGFEMNIDMEDLVLSDEFNKLVIDTDSYTFTMGKINFDSEE